MNKPSELSIARKRYVAHFVLKLLSACLSSGQITYGYDIWVSNHSHTSWLSQCAKEIMQMETQPVVPVNHGFGTFAINLHGSEPGLDELTVSLSPVAFDLLWCLCTMNILRPGIKRIDLQSVDQGGQGYSVTAFGRHWLHTYSEQEFDALMQLL